MTNHTTHNLIQTLSRAEAALHGSEFIAPLLYNRQARLRLGGLIHTMRVAGAVPGWWRCQVHTTRHAVILEAASAWQRGAYLALWPALRLVLLEQHSNGIWLALPFNPAAAWQRFSLHGPLTLHLAEGGQPFERVLARVEGQTVWYDQPDRRADPRVAEALRLALAENRTPPGVAGLSPGEQAAYALLSTRQLATHAEQHIRGALGTAGAHLLGYEQAGTGWRVFWERAGQRGVTLVGDDLQVVSAGICLSGDDERFDLASVVGVVTNAPEYARFDEMTNGQ